MAHRIVLDLLLEAVAAASVDGLDPDGGRLPHNTQGQPVDHAMVCAIGFGAHRLLLLNHLIQDI